MVSNLLTEHADMLNKPENYKAFKDAISKGPTPGVTNQARLVEVYSSYSEENTCYFLGRLVVNYYFDSPNGD